MLTAQEYLNLIHDRGEKNLPIERVYRNLRRTDLFLTAYKNLYANQGAMTPGVDATDTVDGMSMERIAEIIKSLENGDFQWKPTRRVYIPKDNGKTRPLGIPGWKDKMVQEAMRLILEAYYEPQFSTHSHGFRPGRGCHSALTEIKRVWTGTRWFIEGDIKGCFDNIDHDTLLEILAEKIRDDRLMKLIRTMLKAGYVEEWRYKETFSGTPQGGVISPILSNIYLNELDKFVETVLMPRYNKGKRRRNNTEYARLARLQRKAANAGDAETAKAIRKTKVTLPVGDPQDPNYRKLNYVRYADDFILGFIGPKVEAEEIKQEIGKFLTDRLKLQLSEEKTKITNAAKDQARFLGYDIQIAWNNSGKKNGARTINGMVTLRVPQEVRRKWQSRYLISGKTVTRLGLVNRTDYAIVTFFQQQLIGLVNFYQIAVNVGKLHSVRWLMLQSLVKTLAEKHKISAKEVYRKYVYKPVGGNQGIKAELVRKDKENLVATFGTKPIRHRGLSEREPRDTFWKAENTQNELNSTLLAQECSLCGSKNQIEVHHVRKVADVRAKIRQGKGPEWAINMARRNRKTIVICHECHMSIHRGQHDGAKLR